MIDALLVVLGCLLAFLVGAGSYLLVFLLVNRAVTARFDRRAGPRHPVE